MPHAEDDGVGEDRQREDQDADGQIQRVAFAGRATMKDDVNGHDSKKKGDADEEVRVVQENGRAARREKESTSPGREVSPVPVENEQREQQAKRVIPALPMPGTLPLFPGFFKPAVFILHVVEPRHQVTNDPGEQDEDNHSEQRVGIG